MAEKTEFEEYHNEIEECVNVIGDYADKLLTIVTETGGDNISIVCGKAKVRITSLSDEEKFGMKADEAFGTKSYEA